MRKRKNSIKKQTTVLLIVEGTTEKKFFDYVNQKQECIHFTIKEVGTGEYNEVRKKLESELKRNDTYDKIFCIFDGDLVEKSIENFELNLKRMEEKGAHLICSYRCFENWLLYFFNNFTTGTSKSELVKQRLEKISNGKYISETKFEDEFFYGNKNLANVNAKRIAKNIGYDGKNLIAVIKKKSEPFTNIYEIFDVLEIN